MQFDLVDRRRNAGLVYDPFEMNGEEVANPDRPHEPAARRLDEGPPRLDRKVDVGVGRRMR